MTDSLECRESSLVCVHCTSSLLPPTLLSVRCALPYLLQTVHSYITILTYCFYVLCFYTILANEVLMAHLFSSSVLFLLYLGFMTKKNNYYYLIHFCQIKCYSMVHKYQSRQFRHISIYQRQDRDLTESLDILLLKNIQS